MARIEIRRHVAADPASVALLLSGPTGRDLWRDGGELGLAAPQRSGVGFRIDLAIGDGSMGSGRILVAAGIDGPVASDVHLTLSVADAVAVRLRAAAVDFLDDLAVAAQSRSTAA